MIEVSLTNTLGKFSLRVNETFHSKGVTIVYGSSGSGKTSLLRSIAGLTKYHGAKVVFNGQVWQDTTTFVPVHKRRIGYVAQHATMLDHLTLAQNLRYAQKRSGASNHEVERVSQIITKITHVLS